MARALITGVAGFIGSSLADRLLVHGHDVVGIDAFEDYYPRSMKVANLAGATDDSRFTLIEGNLLDLGAPSIDHGCATSLRKAIRESDYVFHLAAQAGVRASWGGSLIFSAIVSMSWPALARLITSSRTHCMASR